MTTVVRREVCARIPTPEGTFRLCLYTSLKDTKEHLALIMGNPAAVSAPLVRVHSECFTGDVLGSLRCDCGEQLHRAMHMIAREGAGVLIYLRQEGRGIGLAEKLRAYNLQDQGFDTVEANILLGHQADERDYDVAAAILSDLGLHRIRLLTNNPEKIQALQQMGIQVVERVPLLPTVTRENMRYLVTKVVRMGHLIDLNLLNGPEATAADLPVHTMPLPLTRWWEQEGFPSDRPWVTLAYAQSLDGSLSQSRDRPTTLSSAASKVLTHRLRSLHEGILVGIQTVLADDPRLTARRVNGPHPQPIVLDSRLRMPLQARLWAHPRGLWLVTTSHAPQERKQLLERRGARIFTVPPDPQGRVALGKALHALRNAGIRTLMVEGGARVLTAFLEQGLADAVAITVAPQYLAGVPAVEHLSTPRTLKEVVYTPIGKDIWIWGRLI